MDLQAAVTRLVSRQLAAAWATWQQALRHSKDKQAKGQRALSYLTNSTLRRAFDWWRSHQQLNLEKHDKLLKALSYFTQGALHRAFDSWRAECGRAAEKQELMRKATNWLLQSGLTKVLGSLCLSAFLLNAEDRCVVVNVCKNAVLLKRICKCMQPEVLRCSSPALQDLQLLLCVQQLTKPFHVLMCSHSHHYCMPC